MIVHFGGGSWGLIAVAFFDSKEGILYAGNLKSGYVSVSVCFLDTVTSIFISHSTVLEYLALNVQIIYFYR